MNITNTLGYRLAFVVLLFAATLQTASCVAQPLNQKKAFTRQDTLRGTVTPERSWWNVLRYDITVEPDYQSRSIRGLTHIEWIALSDGNRMQIDLQRPMLIDSIIIDNKRLSFTNEGNVYWIALNQPVSAQSTKSMFIYFHGQPVVAKRPPWDGGWIFSKDTNGNPWMSVACQGLGASVWYPCKDHQSDEPDRGASLTIIAPDSLMAVGNGRLIKTTSQGNGKTLRTWEVKNPINNYNIVPYIGKYVNWTETYAGEKGNLNCSYYVLDYNLSKAKEQFKQVPKMLKSFEHWFGPYPFYEDGFKLVESPHLGMEHQSAVAYGNGYQNGYRGRDLSGSGWGEKWDFIIIHESGHEWFANNITTNDLADMWVHEGFTNYSETLFTTSEYGVEAGNDYVIGTRKLIANDKPVIGVYGVNQEGSGDMYYKGGNILHTIRQVINDDEKFRGILRGLNKTYYHKTVDSRDIESFISKESGIDFTKVFDQYLRTTQVPVLEYRNKGKKVEVRWTNTIEGFKMPVRLHPLSKSFWINPTGSWSPIEGWDEKTDFNKMVDRNFYIEVKKVN
jgi:aminopeptidase N